MRPRVRWPRLVPDFARPRNRVEAPAQRPGPDVVRSHVARRRRQALGRAAAEDEQVLVDDSRSEEHTSELQSQSNLVCRLLLEKKKSPCLVGRRLLRATQQT